MEKKICRICGLEKEVSDFRICGAYIRTECKECERLYKKEYNKLHNKEIYKRRIDEAKKYREKNREKQKEYMRIYYLTHKNNEDYIKKRKNYIKTYNRPIESIEKHKETTKMWRKNNLEHIKDYAKNYNKTHKEQKTQSYKEWKSKNKNKIREYQKRDSERRKSNPTLKLELQLRNMINTSFKRKGKYKSQKLELICGICSKDLVSYLLETYKQNYNEEWDGKEKVHIDHIKPLKIATTEEEVIKLCHYSNLQLLKAQDNLQKSDKLDWNIQIAN